MQKLQAMLSQIATIIVAIATSQATDFSVDVRQQQKLIGFLVLRLQGNQANCGAVTRLHLEHIHDTTSCIVEAVAAWIVALDIHLSAKDIILHLNGIISEELADDVKRLDCLTNTQELLNCKQIERPAALGYITGLVLTSSER